MSDVYTNLSVVRVQPDGAAIWGSASAAPSMSGWVAVKPTAAALGATQGLTSVVAREQSWGMSGLAEYVGKEAEDLNNDLAAEGIASPEKALATCVATLAALEYWRGTKVTQFPEVTSSGDGEVVLVWRNKCKELRFITLPSGQFRLHRITRRNGILADQKAEVGVIYNRVSEAIEWYKSDSTCL